jgi:hypothetical protein
MNKLSKASEIEKARQIEETKRKDKKKQEKAKLKEKKKFENMIFKEEEKDSSSDEENKGKCSCTKCCQDYRGCVSLSCMAGIAFFAFIGSTLHRCFGACCYPIKERCIGSCDGCDRELNPYKDQNYNPYDHL